MRRRFSPRFALLATLALTLAACGSSSTPAGSGGLTGAAIKLGFICSCSGPQASLLGDTAKVIVAWQDSVNAAGGVNGHPVVVFTKDDGGDPARALSDVEALVTQDQIQAIVGEVSVADAAFTTYIASQGIPVIGGLSPELSFAKSADFFPSGAQQLLQTAGVVFLARAHGSAHLGTADCADSPVCAQVGQLVDRISPMADLRSSSVKVSATASSDAAPCSALKSSGVDALYPAVSAATAVRLVDACAQHHYRPKLLIATATVAGAMLKDPNFQGALLSGTNADPFDTSLPAVRTFQAALNHYAPGVLSGADASYELIDPWVGGQLFAAAAEANDIGPTSAPSDIKKGLYDLRNETLGGLAPPLTFLPGKRAFVPCYFADTITGGKLTSLDGDRPTCLSADAGAALDRVL